MKLIILLGLVLCLLTIHAQDEKPEKEKSCGQKIVEAVLAKLQNLFDSGIETVQKIIVKVFYSIGSLTESVKSCIENNQKAMADENEKYLQYIKYQKSALTELEEKTKVEIAAFEEVAADKIKNVVDAFRNEATVFQKEMESVIAECHENNPIVFLFCISREAGKVYDTAFKSIPKIVMAAKSQINGISEEATRWIEEIKAKSKLETDNILKEIETYANAA